jgi:hypothetical protein
MTPRRGTVSRGSEGYVTAWLPLPETSDPAAVVLELALLDGAGRLRRYNFTAHRKHKH